MESSGVVEIRRGSFIVLMWMLAGLLAFIFVYFSLPLPPLLSCFLILFSHSHFNILEPMLPLTNISFKKKSGYISHTRPIQRRH